MAHRFMDTSYAGELDLSAGVRAEVLRSADGWVLALWAKGASQDLALRLPEVRELALTDARNNPLELTPYRGQLSGAVRQVMYDGCTPHITY